MAIGLPMHFKLSGLINGVNVLAGPGIECRKRLLSRARRSCSARCRADGLHAALHHGDADIALHRLMHHHFRGAYEMAQRISDSPIPPPAHPTEGHPLAAPNLISVPWQLARDSNGAQGPGDPLRIAECTQPDGGGLAHDPYLTSAELIERQREAHRKS